MKRGINRLTRAKPLLPLFLKKWSNLLNKKIINSTVLRNRFDAGKPVYAAQVHINIRAWYTMCHWWWVINWCTKLLVFFSESNGRVQISQSPQSLNFRGADSISFTLFNFRPKLEAVSIFGRLCNFLPQIQFRNRQVELFNFVLKVFLS